jgi:hypothetical protein
LSTTTRTHRVPAPRAAADELITASGSFPEAVRQLAAAARAAGLDIDQDASRARRRIGVGPILPADPGASAKHLRLHAIAERDGGWQCWHCGTELIDYCTAPRQVCRDGGIYIVATGGCQFATEDHLVPRQFGGSTILNSLVLSCSPCNSRKGPS